MPICQINYDSQSARLFALLSQNMLNEDLVAGPPIFEPTTGIITQLYGMCPMTSGSLCTFKQLPNDQWEVSYDDGEESAVLKTDEINRWFTGDY